MHHYCVNRWINLKSKCRPNRCKAICIYRPIWTVNARKRIDVAKLRHHYFNCHCTEYCQRETMTIRCRWKSEVIVMTSARWGRMKTGRCLNIHSNLLATNGQDPMYFGCSQDVKSIVDNRCSGRSECEFRIQDELDAVTPCYPDLVRYLEASYKCVRGE